MISNPVSENLKKIQRCILDFIEKEDNNEENFQNLEILIDELQIKENKYFIISIFHLIIEIANNHNRSSNFFEKLEKIINIFKNEIKQNFSNDQIFDFFKSNKRLLLFFIEEKMIIFNDYIYKEIMSSSFKLMKYPRYFAKEIKDFLSQKADDDEKYDDDDDDEEYEDENSYDEKTDEEIDEEFNIKRHIGENDHEICKIIQKDLIEDFIVYVNQNEGSLEHSIKHSIFETNQFLLVQKEVKNDYYFHKKKSEPIYHFHVSLIQYAAFYGSTQIFKYLKDNVSSLNKSLWPYAIHGQCPEIIHILEEENIDPDSYEDCLIESIKCHHNDIANYIENNYLNHERIEKSFKIFHQSIKCHNYAFVNNYFICQTCLYYFIKYDCPLFVNYLIKTSFVDVNHVTVLFENSDKILKLIY
ncbi:hypothetical protein M9Y10_024781 [Tritrichomonas musculus]|uniref:DUF3447 domain-containing protein n=1 Tax=Tritrichomonas musculus TaxID=1915356 RepID=A0ABR2HB65_9EUKA